MEYIYYAIIILIGCLYFVFKTLILTVDYNSRQKNCTKPILVYVEGFEQKKELLYMHNPQIWYVHKFSDINNPSKKYYNKNARCLSYATKKQVTILIDPANPNVFFYPNEVKPRITDGILCGIMSIAMIYAIILVLNRSH